MAMPDVQTKPDDTITETGEVGPKRRMSLSPLNQRRWRNFRRKVLDVEKDFPGIKEGVLGMKFIDAVVKSSAKNAKWTKL